MIHILHSIVVIDLKEPIGTQNVMDLILLDSMVILIMDKELIGVHLRDIEFLWTR